MDEQQMLNSLYPLRKCSRACFRPQSSVCYSAPPCRVRYLRVDSRPVNTFERGVTNSTYLIENDFFPLVIGFKKFQIVLLDKSEKSVLACSDISSTHVDIFTCGVLKKQQQRIERRTYRVCHLH